MYTLPIITKITQQKKLHERFNFFLYGKFELIVDGLFIFDLTAEYAETAKID